MDECESSPCQHDSNCVDGNNGFECNCTAGYTDEICSGKITTIKRTKYVKCLLNKMSKPLTDISYRKLMTILIYISVVVLHINL